VAAGTTELHPWVQAGADYLDDAASEFDSNTPTMLHDDWEMYRKDASEFMDAFDIIISPVAPGPALPHPASASVRRAAARPRARIRV